MLQVFNLHKRYGDTTILKNVSFVINPGERLGLIGPNGCGKTTLLRIIAGQEQPDQGSIQRHPTTLRLGYLEQGQRYDQGDTLADFLRTGEAALEQASARLEELAAALAKADEVEQASLMEAYAQAREHGARS